MGWDRSGNTGTGGVGIHHPRGDVKKISTYSATPVSSTCLNSNFWDIGFIQTANGYSVMQPGSSGSPLINSSRRIIGQLYGPGFCSLDQCNNPGNQRVAYGKFSVSWTGNGATDNRRRLSNWLDPNNTGVSILDGSSGCINSYANQTVTTNKTVIGCNNLNVQNVTVTNNAKLTLDAPGEIVINGPFEVQLGASLDVK